MYDKDAEAHHGPSAVFGLWSINRWHYQRYMYQFEAKVAPKGSAN